MSKKKKHSKLVEALDALVMVGCCKKRAKDKEIFLPESMQVFEICLSQRNPLTI